MRAHFWPQAGADRENSERGAESKQSNLSVSEYTVPYIIGKAPKLNKIDT